MPDLSDVLDDASRRSREDDHERDTGGEKGRGSHGITELS